MGVVWACLPFSRAFLFQLAFSLGCVPFFGLTNVSGFIEGFLVSTLGFKGIVISWAPFAKLIKPTREQASLRPLPESFS